MSMRRVPLCLVVLALLLALLPMASPPAPVAAYDPTVAPAEDAAGATFDSDGAHLAPGVTLRLAALGRGDALTAIDPVSPTDDGTRAEYAHAAVSATEWYLRQGGGIEQGITLAVSPIGSGPLTFTIATPGAAVLVHEAGDAATLIVPGTAGSTERWQYDGLRVTDATGRMLPAHLTQPTAGGIGITVDDAGAVYPVIVDPFVQRQTLAVSGTAQFGRAVALSADGNTALVGAPGTNSNPGTAYVFTRGTGGYTLNTTLAVTGTQNFGYAVALSGDGSTALVGVNAPYNVAGTAYVFTRGTGGYTLNATLAAAGTTYFGSAVALSADGGTALVGANSSSGSAVSAYVFTRGTSGYTLNATLATAGTATFGIAVALSGDGSTALVGAQGTNSNEGTAYVFTRGTSGYTPNATLFVNYTLQFGSAVALSGDGSTALVGAQSTYPAGTAYVFTRSTSGYTLNANLVVTGSFVFGNAVALSADGGTALVGAQSTSPGGTAYVFTRGSGYTLNETLVVTGSSVFGSGVALSADGSTALVGARATTNNQGTAYVFTTPPVIGTDGTTTPQTITVGQPFPTHLAAYATDTYGTPLSGATVTFRAPTSGASGAFAGGVTTATATTDTSGYALAPAFTANSTTGNYSVYASVTTAGGTATTSFGLTNTADVPATIAPAAGSGQSATLGSAFITALQAIVRDSHGNPVSGTTVTFTAPAGSNIATVTFTGGVATITATTDSDGIAAVTATAAGRPGTATVTASVPTAGGTASTAFGLANTPNATTLTLTGFSPPTAPTTGGIAVTLTGTNLTGATAVSFGGTPGTNIAANTATSVTVTAPPHAESTIDISVTAGGQTATIYGFTYLTSGSIAPQPGGHVPPGSTNGITPMLQPARHAAPGVAAPAPNAVAPTTPLPTPPDAQPARH